MDYTEEPSQQSVAYSMQTGEYLRDYLQTDAQ